MTDLPEEERTSALENLLGTVESRDGGTCAPEGGGRVNRELGAA